MHRSAPAAREWASAIKVTGALRPQSLQSGEKRKKDAEEERREMARMSRYALFSPHPCLSYNSWKWLQAPKARRLRVQLSAFPGV